MSRERFIEIVTADQPDAPAYFTYDAVLNTRERPTLDAGARARAAAAHARRGARAGRRRRAAARHARRGRVRRRPPPGSVNIGLGGSFATWCGTILDPERPIVLIAEPGREDEAATRLGRIGFDNVAGYLEGGMQALDAAPELIDRTERITAGSLAEQLAIAGAAAAGRRAHPGEWEERGSTARSTSRSRGSPSGSPRLPRDRPLVVYCASGYRSAIAASLLAREGFARRRRPRRWARCVGRGRGRDRRLSSRCSPADVRDVSGCRRRAAPGTHRGGTTSRSRGRRRGCARRRRGRCAPRRRAASRARARTRTRRNRMSRACNGNP